MKLFGHLSAEDRNCFLNNCSVKLIDKTDGSDPTTILLGCSNCNSL